MIKRLFVQDEALLLRGCALDRVLGCKVSTLYNSYGDDERYVCYWAQLEGEQLTALIAFFAGLVTVCIDEANGEDALDELAAFCSFSERVMLEATGVPAFANRMKGMGMSVRTLTVLACLSPTAAHASTVSPPTLGGLHGRTEAPACRIEKAPNLAEICGLLGECDPAFEKNVDYAEWYFNLSVRVRKGLSCVYTVIADNLYAATAGIYDLDHEIALLSNVVTLEAYRGRGYASSLIAELVADMTRRGLLVCTVAIDEAAERLYAGLGFEGIGIVYLMNN